MLEISEFGDTTEDSNQATLKDILGTLILIHTYHSIYHLIESGFSNINIILYLIIVSKKE